MREKKILSGDTTEMISEKHLWNDSHINKIYLCKKMDIDYRWGFQHVEEWTAQFQQLLRSVL